MKKIVLFALLFVGMTTLAQEKTTASNEQFTTEQKNQLRLKRMILELNLNTVQQKEMAIIIAEQTTKHELIKKERQANKASGKKMTAEERFVKVNKMLDEKIALKTRVRAILTPEQFEKWDKMQERNRAFMKGKMKMRKSKSDLPKE
jgi:hypothetical protein